MKNEQRKSAEDLYKEWYNSYSDEQKKQIDKIKNLNTNKKFKVKSKTKLFYLFPILNIIGSISILIGLYLWGIGLLWFIIIGIFLFPIVVLSIVFLIGRLFIDRRKIEGKIITILSTKYIIAKFFMENGITDRVVCKLNEDGRSFVFNKGLYMIDKQCIWYENKKPTSHYLFNLPNPLKFGFENGINDFIKKIRTEIENLKKDSKEVIDNSGHLIDISYSSISLQLFKKDKFLEEMHRNPEANKIMMLLIGVIFALIVVLIIVSIFGGK